jgi:nitroreductase
MNISDAIRQKRAVRQFKDQPLPQEAVLAILNAGRRAQSSKNSQPWRFVAVTDKATLKALSECGQWAGHLAGAALGVTLLTENPEEKFQRLFDLGQAAAYMQLAAWELGIGSCMATLYQGEQARQILNVPPAWHLRFAISFGYPLDPAALTRPPRQGGREALAEMIHWETW